MPVIQNEAGRTSGRSPRLAVLLAFAVIYLVWGSTFIAIRIAVHDIPPLLAAGVRFSLAGFLLYGWRKWRGAPSPSSLEWRNLLLLGTLMFLVTYSALFWAEKSVPSGIASILVATLPASTALLEIFVFKRYRLSLPLFMGIVLGFGGVAFLAVRPQATGAIPSGALAIFVGELGWALGSVLTGKLRLPESKAITAGAEMAIGGCLLLLCSFLFEETSHLQQASWPSILALVYLITAGSLLGFTAFVWLLGRMPATTVSSHAYVNPVVALCLGYWIGGETLSPVSLFGALLVISSVLLIIRSKAPTPG